MSATGVLEGVERRPQTVRRWTRTRIAGHTLVGLWIAAGLGIAMYLVTSWSPELVDEFGPRYLSGLYMTLALTAVSMVVGGTMAIPITFGRMSDNPVAAGLSYAYVYFFRGTPLIAQLFLFYYGAGAFRPFFEAVGLWVFFREAWFCTLLAFSLNTAAYQAEIFRGALQSVPRGQWEGAASLGLHKMQTFWKVILPQAAMVALRPYGNEFVLMIKGSAVAAIITVNELMWATRLAYSRTYDFQTYIWAAIIYFIIVQMLSYATELVERRLTRHLKR